MKKLLKYLQLSIFLLFLGGPVLAQTFGETEQGVDINAAITEDTNSTLVVLPNTVEIKERATVTVTIRDGNLEPISGHYIQLIAPGLTFTQPSQASNADGRITVQVYAQSPGSYVIQAQDITYDDLVIDILDTDTLYVTPLETPFLLEEPIYTKGTKNTLFWNSIGSGYRYKIEVSESNTFNTIKDSSGWITGTLFEFTGLENEVMYFYRVKARNSYGGESGWSNVRYSVQDSEAPVINIISIRDVGENNNIEWEGNYEVEIRYKVKDNLFLDSTEFYCVRKDGTRYSCGEVTNNGVLYTATIKLNELEKEGLNELYLIYNFCVEATDSAGNTSQNCDIELEIPPWQSEEPTPEPEPEPEEPPQEVPTYVGRIVRDFVDNTQIIMDDMFGGLNEYDLQDISTTTAIATITFSIGSLLGGLLYIPMYLLQLIFGFLSWLGLRKRGEYSGYVYDSKTKEPIAQSVVRVYDKDGRLVWTDVTDSRGLFELSLPNGKYKLKAVARGYEFPSTTIFGKKDYPLENVYHGEEFEVEDGVVPEFSIPMDSTEMGWIERVLTTLRGRFRGFYKIFSVLFFIFGLIFSVYIYNLNPNWFNFIIILLYIPAFVLVVRGLFKKELEYGVVKDDKGEPLSNIAVGLRDKEYGRIIAKRNTDGKGRYRFIVDRGEYELEILDTEYEVVEIEEEENRRLADGSMLVALDTVVKPIKVEK